MSQCSTIPISLMIFAATIQIEQGVPAVRHAAFPGCAKILDGFSVAMEKRLLCEHRKPRFVGRHG